MASKLNPYLNFKDNTRQAMEFYKTVFGGTLTMTSFKEGGMSSGPADDQKVMHATVQVGDSTIMICDEMEGAPAQPVILYLYVEDAEQLFKKATQAKATVLHEMEDQFYGDRVGAVKDEWGNVWWIGKHVEDVDEKELERRSKIVMKERREKGNEVHA